MQLQCMLTTVAASVMVTFAALDIGGWGYVDIGAEETQLLTKALGDDALYAPAVKTRACFLEITSLGNQVVSGVKYKYGVKGCTTTTAKSGGGKCAGEYASCKPESLVIILIDQPWTDTLQILSIDKDSNTTTSNQTEITKNSTSGDGSAGDKSDPILNDVTSGSTGSMATSVPAITTMKPATKAPLPSSAVPTPTPTPKSSASIASVASLAALGLAVLTHML